LGSLVLSRQSGHPVSWRIDGLTTFHKHRLGSVKAASTVQSHVWD
jgi:hypothetical protein